MNQPSTEKIAGINDELNRGWSQGALFDFIRTMGVVFIAAFLIRHFLVQPFIVDGSSMLPTFSDQEYILVDKLSYRFRQPERGDVIVFHPPDAASENFIKRVIGLPGEKIEIVGEQIYINGQKVIENYTTTERNADTGTVISRILGPNEYYVLGDNRDHSKDSRELGAIDRSRIIGRAWLVLYPLEKLSLVTRPTYPMLASPQSEQATGYASRFAIR